MSPSINIPFPFGGVSDMYAAQDQERVTTRHALNMRSLDPISGRKRGGQRSGITKFVGEAIGVGHIQDLITINNDVRLTSYTARTDSPLEEWGVRAPADSYVRDIAVTLGGDVWIISGSDIVAKYNGSGKKLDEIRVPLRSSQESVSCIALDVDGSLYVATQSEFADPSGNIRYAGSVLRYEPNPLNDEEMILIWNHDASGRVSSILYSEGVVYAVVNKVDESSLVALTQLTSDTPIVNWTRPVPRPAAHVTATPDGDLLVSCEPRVGRDVIEEGEFCSVDKVVDWTPTDLPIGSLRSWHDAQQLAEFTDNQVIDFWFDSSGSGRNIWAATDGEGPVGEGNSPATYGARFVENAICGLAGVRFDLESNSDGLFPGFTSGRGSASLIPPGNEPSFITMIFKSRAQGYSDEDQTAWGKILERGGQPYHAIIQSTNGKFFHGEFTNPLPADNTADDGTNEPVNGGNAEGQLHGRVGGMRIDNLGDICILTLAYDPGGDDEGSFFRINGSTDGIYTDQFTLGDFRQSDATRIGYTVWGSQRANMDLCEMIVYEGEYVWPTDYETTGAPGGGDWDGAPDTPTNSEMEHVEGYLAHRYGVQSILHDDHPFKAAPPSGSGPGDPVTVNPYVEVLKSPDGILAKYSRSGGDLIWAVSGSGIGHSAVADHEDGVYTVGPPAGDPGDLYRKVVDQGFEVSVDGADGAWSTASSVGGVFATVPGTRLAVDSEKNLYVPSTYSDGNDIGGITKYTSDGTSEWHYQGAGNYMLCCAMDTIETDFGDDSIGESEFMYVGRGPLSPATSENDTLFKLRLVDVAVSVGAPRENIHLAVCDGHIRRMTPGAATEVETVVGGEGVLNSGSRIVSSVISQGKVYFIDGENYVVYDPDTNTASVWEAEGAGSLPKRPKLIAEWRSRVLLARIEGEPQNMYSSETGKPTGWNLFPPTLRATSAFALAASEAGPVPDTINCLIAYSDDQLIIGGDHTIHVLVGDPLAGQLDPARGTFPSGQIRLVSDTVGMAYGRPFCKDESGYVYFFGSRGGVYRMVPGSAPQKISEEIDRRIMELDMDFFTVRMVWNEADRGLHVFFVPIDVVPPASPAPPPAGPVSGPSPVEISDNPTDQSAAGNPILHWFWFEEDRSWWGDQFAAHDMDPTAVSIADGDDPGDRVMLIGGRDGFVRKWDPSSKNDDGLAIAASVTMGPLQPRSVHDQVRFANFQFALASDQDGAKARLFASKQADQLGAALAERDLVPGSNASWRKRVRGQSVFAQVFNDQVDERFSVEAMGADYTRGGRTRS